MAIFVRWEWKERTKTFLVIFYFVDDRSKQNLRFRLKVLDDWKDCVGLEDPENNPDCPPQMIMTWAPTHLEIALLGDVLRYANIIDGLDINEKKQLRIKLELETKENDPCVLNNFEIEKLSSKVPFTIMVSLEGAEDWYICSELTPEYIEYLKKILHPFQ